MVDHQRLRNEQIIKLEELKLEKEELEVDEAERIHNAEKERLSAGNI